MKRVRVIIILVLMITINSFAESVRFSPLPIQPKDELIGSHLPLIRYIEEKTGLNVEIVYIEDYKKLLEEFRKGNLDIITLGPLPYLELKKSYPDAKAILFIKEKDGSSFYSCSLITSMDGPSKVRDINGPIALPQKLSTCGYFSANIILSSEGKDIKKLGYKHLPTHNDVVEAVLRGEYLAGSVRTNIAKEYEGFGIKILKETPKWPAFSIVVNTKTLKPQTVDKIKDALLSAPQGELKKLVVGKFGFRECKEEDFEIVRKYENFKTE